MSHLRSLALLLLLPLAAASAQQPAMAPAQQAAIRVTTTAVSRVTLIRVHTGQAGAVNRDIVDNLIPIYEAAKKAGIITGYNFFNKSTMQEENDWQRGVTLNYANWAAIDGLAAKMEAITLAHYGTAERRTAANAARAAMTTTVSAFFTTSQSYTR